MRTYKLLPFVAFLFILSSCTERYKIEGTSSIGSLDGQMLYVKVLKDGQWVKHDSAEVIHGNFKLKGEVDSVMMATLYMGNEAIMPLVLEDGRIKLTLSETEMKAEGTTMNERLYSFIAKKNSFDEQMDDLGTKEAQMVMDGGDLAEIHNRLTHEGEALARQRDELIKHFICANFENILGPGVFLMWCSNMPYPVVTPSIAEILKKAPDSFKRDKLVAEFVSKARENMQLMEEHQRMEQNLASSSTYNK